MIKSYRLCSFNTSEPENHPTGILQVMHVKGLHLDFKIINAVLYNNSLKIIAIKIIANCADPDEIPQSVRQFTIYRFQVD